MALWISFLLLFTRGILPLLFCHFRSSCHFYCCFCSLKTSPFFHRVPSLIAWTILAVGVIEHVDNREDTHRIFWKKKVLSQFQEGNIFLGLGFFFLFSKAGNDTLGGPSRLWHRGFRVVSSSDQPPAPALGWRCESRPNKSRMRGERRSSRWLKRRMETNGSSARMNRNLFFFILFFHFTPP